MQKNPVILITSTGYMGHLTPILRIVAYLKAKTQYTIILATSKQSFQKAQKIFPNTQIFPIEDKMNQILEHPNDIPPFIDTSNLWRQPIRQIINQTKPDLILSDYTLISVFDIAKEKNIKLIINFPVRLETPQIYRFPNFANSFTIGGFIIYKHSMLSETILRKFPGFTEIGEYLQNNLILINSFYGFDKTLTLPPNFKVTGPLVNELSVPSKLPSDLEKWLTRIKSEKLDIIYVSFGSILGTSAEFTFKLYSDLKRTGKAVIWSMKKGNIPQNNDRFFVRDWLPQTQILKLPEVKVMISHCGWGAVTESIYYEKPILATPGFADQIPNSLTVEAKKLGQVLILPPKMHWKLTQLYACSWSTQDFSNKINDLIQNPIYKKSLNHMKNLLEQPGGLASVLDNVQKCLKNGSSHLIDESMSKVRQVGLMDTIWLGLKISLGVAVFLNRNRIKNYFS